MIAEKSVGSKLFATSCFLFGLFCLWIGGWRIINVREPLCLGEGIIFLFFGVSLVVGAIMFLKNTKKIIYAVYWSACLVIVYLFWHFMGVFTGMPFIGLFISFLFIPCIIYLHKKLQKGTVTKQCYSEGARRLTLIISFACTVIFLFTGWSWFSSLESTDTRGLWNIVGFIGTLLVASFFTCLYIARYIAKGFYQKKIN